MSRIPLALIVSASFGAALVGCASSSPSANHDPASSAAPSTLAASFETDRSPIQGSLAVLQVGGLGCPLCANNVDESLSAVAGVRDVAVDLGTGRVTVALNDLLRPSRADLAKAVKDSGFTLSGIEVR